MEKAIEKEADETYRTWEERCKKEMELDEKRKRT